MPHARHSSCGKQCLSKRQATTSVPSLNTRQVVYELRAPCRSQKLCRSEKLSAASLCGHRLGRRPPPQRTCPYCFCKGCWYPQGAAPYSPLCLRFWARAAGSPAAPPAEFSAPLAWSCETPLAWTCAADCAEAPTACMRGRPELTLRVNGAAEFGLVRCAGICAAGVAAFVVDIVAECTAKRRAASVVARAAERFAGDASADACGCHASIDNAPVDA
eukprot:5655787-Pleurochrysis_carterae.AAC.1